MKTVSDAESPTVGVGSVRKRKVCVPGVERLGMSRRRVTTRRKERHEEENQVEEQEAEVEVKEEVEVVRRDTVKAKKNTWRRKHIQMCGKRNLATPKVI